MMYNEIDEVKALAEIMKEYGLTSIKVKLDEDTVFSLKRENSPSVQPVVQPVQAAAAAASEKTEVQAPEIKGGTAVKSPMVGVFYSAPSPDEKPYVQVGDTVKKGDVLCIVEAMKLMNEITAEQDGQIVEICAEDGGLVEYGQTLFIMK